ncbi:MAG: cellulase family glycosylhydrolase [Acidimicrobiia bacterium]
MLLLVLILLPATAANTQDRINLADGSTQIIKNAAVKNGYVEFGSTTTTTVPSTTPTTPSVPTGKFYVVGKQIVDPDGNIFIPMGANVAIRQGQYETGYIFNVNGTATDHSQDVLNWGWNTVRVNLIFFPESGSPTKDEIFQGLSKFINEYTSKKIVVLIDTHDATGQNLPPSDPKVQKILGYLDELTKTYSNNPYVWFNGLNEPFQDDDPTSLTNWIAQQNAVYQTIRKNAPNNIFVADLPGYGNSVESLVDGNLGNFSSSKCNVVYSWHDYGYINGYADDATHKIYYEKLASKNIAVLIGEIGDPLTLNEGTAGSPAQNRIGAYAAMKYAPANGFGILWWHATGDSSVFLTYSLMQDRSAPWPAATTGQGLSAAGKTFWDLTHPKKTTAKFTGNIADSHC